ncbi:hypothetical protein B0T16DRAFT_412088 [Cercophora newfieldiana]|uniref:Uncharacterized protein n=1 Tax=Cercophora newfieldiana TaxID=92897 RepID=A0AA40CP59_9PEZI|nr:hypothetical protein B0T16DRAFT_412088 [Cercophora newfieldiana]
MLSRFVWSRSTCKYFVLCVFLHWPNVEVVESSWHGISFVACAITGKQGYSTMVLYIHSYIIRVLVCVYNPSHD